MSKPNVDIETRADSQERIYAHTSLMALDILYTMVVLSLLLELVFSCIKSQINCIRIMWKLQMKIMTMIRAATEKNEDEQMMGETKYEWK